jgi:Spy/CpxP family protein refolding chaperone
MKKMIASAALLVAVLIAGNVAAQDSTFKKWKKHPGKEHQGGHQGGGGQAIKHMQERLKLTDEQTKQITEINQTAMSKLKEAHKDGEKPDVQTRRNINTERDAAIKKVLTADQLPEYDKLKAERKEMAKKGMHDKKEPKKDEVE